MTLQANYCERSESGDAEKGTLNYTSVARNKMNISHNPLQLYQVTSSDWLWLQPSNIQQDNTRKVNQHFGVSERTSRGLQASLISAEVDSTVKQQNSCEQHFCFNVYERKASDMKRLWQGNMLLFASGCFGAEEEQGVADESGTSSLIINNDFQWAAILCAPSLLRYLVTAHQTLPGL